LIEALPSLVRRQDAHFHEKDEVTAFGLRVTHHASWEMISYAVFQVSQTVGAVAAPDFFVLSGTSRWPSFAGQLRFTKILQEKSSNKGLFPSSLP